jgi:hypothetical protein
MKTHERRLCMALRAMQAFRQSRGIGRPFEPIHRSGPRRSPAAAAVAEYFKSIDV